MKPRLARPLLAALVSGAVVAGGAVFTAPASAADPTPSAGVEASETASPVPTSAPSEIEPSEIEPSGSATTSAPVSPEPSAPASETSSPVPSDPASPAAPSSAAPSSATPLPSVTTTPVPPRDTTKPTGTFKLNAGAFWTGQQVKLTQEAADYGDPGKDDSDKTLSRKISWGDGHTTTLAAGVPTAAKQYSRAGKFKVTVTLRDRAGNTFTTPARTVTVTVPGKISLTKKSIYQGQLFGVRISAIPAGTKTVAVNWGDGWVGDVLPYIKKGVVNGTILYRKGTNKKISGNVAVKVAFYNKLGPSSYRTAGTIKVLTDSWKPVIKVAKPAKANRISSWKTVRGTVSDKGAGVRLTYVLVTRYTTSGKGYCLTPKRKWLRFTSNEQWGKNCIGTLVTPKKGKWSFKVPSGLTKGYVYVDAWAYDLADNRKNTYREGKLTRS